VLKEWGNEEDVLLDRLPLSYDGTTLRTIEQIDVLWLRRRSIVRAFEVEHTTAVYSGILRMADLLALQPNMDIKLHIVAPASKREKVFQEIRRPVFSLLEKGPLAESCTYLSYDSLRELGGERHLISARWAKHTDDDESSLFHGPRWAAKKLRMRSCRARWTAASGTMWVKPGRGRNS
jgi:hypothetical protein